MDDARPRKQPETLPHWVAEVVAEQIGEGRYREGDHLREAHLAEELGVSRSPIREAFRLLEQDGLVTICPRKGATVARLTAEQVDAIYQCRIRLATFALELAVPNITPEDIAYMRSLLEQMEQAVAAPEFVFEDFSRPNRELHRVVHRRAGNGVLEELLASLGRRVRRQRYISLSDPARAKASLEGHRRMMRAIEAGDPQGAAEAGAQNIRAGWEAVREYLSRQSRDAPV